MKHRDYTIPPKTPKDCTRSDYYLRDDINQVRYLCDQMYPDDILEDLIHYIHNKKSITSEELTDFLKNQEEYLDA
jgi:hypothetical protein